MIINFANQELILLKDGAIFWPKTESIILGDLHLEKGSFFAMKGNFLPPYDSIDTLRKLSDIAKKIEQIKFSYWEIYFMISLE